jgi:hypothetical protein
MKLSKETLSVLKNFASINDGLMFRSGNVLRTCDANKQVMAETTITENVPGNFGIFDLNKFLSVLSLHEGDTTLQIDDGTKSLILKDKSGRSTTTYRFCDASNIKNSPEKSVSMPAPDVVFNLTQNDFELVMRAANNLGVPKISIQSDGSKIVLGALYTKNTSAHTNQLEIGDGNGKKYKMLFKTENLKMITGSYEVSISFKGIASFKNTTKPIQYWVATEIGSTGEA